MRPLRPSFAMIGACLLGPSLVATPLANAQETQKSAVPAPTITTKQGEILARVMELDTVNRRATLRNTQGGGILTVYVPKEVLRFDDLHTGDHVIVRYVSATAVSFTRTKKDGIRESTETKTVQGRSDRRTVEVVAVVQKINRRERTAVLRGPTRTVVAAVPADVDLSKLKVGDEVHALIEEATVLELLPAKAR